jgi:hypothetical protein
MTASSACPSSWALAKVVLKKTRNNARYYAGQLDGAKVLVPLVGRMRRTSAADAALGEERSLVPASVFGPGREGVAVLKCADAGRTS